jgi:putative transposase
MEKRKPYPSDINDDEWQIIEPLIPPAKSGGRPRSCDMREILNGIFYEVRSGCAWRMLPHDLPPWQSVYHYFRQWKGNGTLERMNQTLRTQIRIADGRDAEPSAAILDSQLKPRQSKEFVVMTQVKRSRDVNAIF